jgi:rubredoxin
MSRQSVRGAARPVLNTTVMSWHCPACNTILRHNDLEPQPKSGTRYRCHVCRLELEALRGTEVLVIAPLENEPPIEDPPSRTLPAPIIRRKIRRAATRRR